MFIITKTFIDGALKGLTIEDRSPVGFTVGLVYGGKWTGGKYRVEKSERIDGPFAKTTGAA